MTSQLRLERVKGMQVQGASSYEDGMHCGACKEATSQQQQASMAAAACCPTAWLSSAVYILRLMLAVRRVRPAAAAPHLIHVVHGHALHGLQKSQGWCDVTCPLTRNDTAVTQAVTSGANPVSIKRGIDKTCAHLVARLGELSRDVKGTEDIRVRAPSTFNS